MIISSVVIIIIIIMTATNYEGTIIIIITPNLHTNIVDFRGFDSSTILSLGGGIPRPIGISLGFPRKV